MDKKPTSYLTPKAELRERNEIAGKGIYAVEPILKDELLILWSGVIMNRAELEALSDKERSMTAQVHDQFYQVSPLPGEPADFINHCCEPNAGMWGEITVVARRDIEPGEEICIDYAMVDGDPYDDFDCKCGTEKCRGRVSGDDWRLPELQKRYKGYFSPYLQRRIDKLNKQE
jgi:SET domain-containing protein